MLRSHQLTELLAVVDLEDVVAFVGGGSRFGLLCGIPRGSVCHPSILFG